MRLSKTITAAQVRELGIKRLDVIGLTYQWAEGHNGFNHFLTVNGQRKVAFSGGRLLNNSIKKIKRMELGLGWKAPLPTDEELGIIEANKRGENPFAYSMMCADPKRNKIVK